MDTLKTALLGKYNHRYYTENGIGNSRYALTQSSLSRAHAALYKETEVSYAIFFARSELVSLLCPNTNVYDVYPAPQGVWLRLCCADRLSFYYV